MKKKIIYFVGALSSINMISSINAIQPISTNYIKDSNEISFYNNKKIANVNDYINKELAKGQSGPKRKDVVTGGPIEPVPYPKNFTDADLNGAVFDLMFGQGEPTELYWEYILAYHEYEVIETLAAYKIEAWNYSSKNYGVNDSTLTDGVADAFRHLFFVALASAKYGKNYTRKNIVNIYPGTYTGTDIAQSNRIIMDNHNNEVGLTLGEAFRVQYESMLTGTLYEKMNVFIQHVLKCGSYYDVIELKPNKQGFMYTTQGVKNKLFPPFC